jgi:hypothetical protein
MVDGFFMDQQTSKTTVSFLVYNGHYRLFHLAEVYFQFEEGGSVSLTYDLQTFPVELYFTQTDVLRFALELIFVACVCANLVTEGMELFHLAKSTGSIFSYFKSVWNYIDLANLSLFLIQIYYWLAFKQKAEAFAPAERYNVYHSLDDDARYLQLSETCISGCTQGAISCPCDPGTGLHSMLDNFDDARELSTLRQEYMTINGMCMMLMVLRVLKCLDFQPRLAIVTKTLEAAMNNLGHFMVVFGLVFTGFTLIAHESFGSKMSEFSTVGLSFNTCFNILMGEIGVNGDFMAMNGNDKYLGLLFYYAFLFIIFFILLNILLGKPNLRVINHWKSNYIYNLTQHNLMYSPI